MQKVRILGSIGIALIALAALIIAFVSFNTSQVENGKLGVEWQQFLPGISGRRIIETVDGGYLSLGENASVQEGAQDWESDIFVNHEPILVKTDSSGDVMWQKTFLVEGLVPRLMDLIQTSDGGYAVVGGNTSYSNGIVSSNQFCFIKLDSKGNMLWTKTYTCPNLTRTDGFSSLFQASDGKYVMIGNLINTWDYHGYSSTFLFEIDSSGNLLLNKTIGAGYPNSIIPVGEGYMIFGSIPRSGGGGTFELVKVDSIGNILWSKEYQGGVSSFESCGIPTSDDGYLLGGLIVNNDTGWLVKTDSQGNMLWNKTYDDVNGIYSVAQAHDGGYIIGGTANANLNNFVAWIAKIDSLGNIAKQIKTGGLGSDLFTTPYSILQANDGGFVCIGTWNGSVEASSLQKFWILKISS